MRGLGLKSHPGIVVPEDSNTDFHALRSQRSVEAVLIAIDLIELNGLGRRDLPLLDRKRRLPRLIGNTRNWRATQYGDYLKRREREERSN